MPAIEMRLLRLEQLEFLRILRNDWRVRRWFNMQEEISSSDQQRWFTNYMEDHDWFIFVAFADNKPVGYGQIKQDGLNSAEIGCAVDPEVWNQGYGTAIIQWLIDYSQQKLGILPVWLQVHADNDAALALYKHNGFKVTSEIGEPIIREGIAIPRLRMVLGE